MADSAEAMASGNVDAEGPVSASLVERLELPGAFLSRTDLRALGLERRAVDAIFAQVPNVILPGYSRPLIRVGDYLVLIKASTYSGRDRVHPPPASGNVG